MTTVRQPTGAPFLQCFHWIILHGRWIHFTKICKYPMKVTFFAHEDPTGARVLGAAVSATLECIIKTTVWVTPIRVTFFDHKNYCCWCKCAWVAESTKLECIIRHDCLGMPSWVILCFVHKLTMMLLTASMWLLYRTMSTLRS